MSVSQIQLSAEGPQISRLVFGAWRLADRPETNSAAAVGERIRAAIDMGMTTFDHADIYGNYTVEELFGEALKSSPELKNKIQIVTKTGIKLLSGNRPEHRLKSYDSSGNHVEQSVDRSLQNLGVEKIDCLLIHRPDFLVDPDELAHTFDKLRTQGKVLSFGVSNHTVSQMELLQSRLKFPLVTNQVEMSPLCLDPLNNGVLDHCLKRGVSPMAWSPLGGGRLFHDSSSSTQRLVKCLESVAARQDLAGLGVDHIALAWLLAHPARIVPVVGTANLERLRSYGLAEEVKLSREDWYEIWQASTGHEVP